MALKIKDSTLRAIMSDNSTVRERLKGVLRAWLHGQGLDTSWQILCEVLRGKLVDRKDIAEQIEKNLVQNHSLS